MLRGSVFPSLRGICIAIDEAISGVCYYHETATQPTAARNDDIILYLAIPFIPPVNFVA
ncbi:hypothetical protein BTU51_0010 [Rickettsia rickettsii]|uniref:Uncharacterized protein n=1 Tax=Rickettsia rickettsii (strain Iowa) TaxID=452659 RepID=B0BVR6_RICRO|nr:hypothetical protein RrIowa_0010 [Rickettsia rickettsii str. Iowa]APU54894.1 hypothetical protein BTU50_0010 [Rickettsia rickettsii]APU56272.1 hypothetical protein BTU51_0010 [Rickettsia rickettsii]